MPIFLDHISKEFDPSHPIVNPTTLTFQDEKTTVLIGPSGCGKSTLLRLMVGLIAPTTGRIFFGQQELTTQTAQLLRKEIGYVIQNGGLFPHLTAQENVSLLAHFLKYDHQTIQKRLSDLCELVRLSSSTLALYPFQLSGGERQRVSLMRALMLNPKYILLDEPLAALDPITRYELQLQLKQIFSYLHKTVILVTHDMREAAYFGETIILMRSGSLIQQGSFQDLIDQPAEPFVTEFIRAQQPPLESLIS